MDIRFLAEDIKTATVFLWHAVFVYLMVQMVLSYIIYRNNREKIFLTYFVYVFLLLTYVICRNIYFYAELAAYPPTYIYSYYVQVVYLCVYFHFGLSLLNFGKYYPVFTKWVYRYMAVAVSIGTVVFVATLTGLAPLSYMSGYYFKYFFPVHIVFALFILFRMTGLKAEKQKNYFLIGSFAFLFFGLVAVVATVLEQSKGFMGRGDFFYVGIIIECTCFAIGLGMRVRDIYQDKLDTERQLNATQKELQDQMLLRIEEQEEDKKVLQREKELQTLATQVALLENKVLHSQMNSHFIFNVLNSIKAYIIEQDVEKAVTYLNKFSKLIRMVLNTSRAEKHTLADELEAIRLYVDIEKMRVADELSVTVQADITSRYNDIPFPALLIQPFVENAIWHGLIPSAGEKELDIRIKNSGPEILIEIIDNGIGYSRSLSEKKDPDQHHSHGVTITQERIDQFNKQHPVQLSFGIEDRPDATGTRVWIRIT